MQQVAVAIVAFAHRRHRRFVNCRSKNPKHTCPAQPSRIRARHTCNITDAEGEGEVAAVAAPRSPRTSARVRTPTPQQRDVEEKTSRSTSSQTLKQAHEREQPRARCSCRSARRGRQPKGRRLRRPSSSGLPKPIRDGLGPRPPSLPLPSHPPHCPSPSPSPSQAASWSVVPRRPHPSQPAACRRSPTASVAASHAIAMPVVSPHAIH